MTNYHHNIVGSEALRRPRAVPGYGAVRLGGRRPGLVESRAFALVLLLSVAAGVLVFALVRRGVLIL